MPAEPLIAIALKATSRDDADRLGVALSMLTAENPALVVSTDHESGQTILGGSSEQQLDDAIDALKADGAVSFNVGAPQVAYRETITSAAEVDVTHSRVGRNGGQFARVKLRFEPGAAGSGVQFRTEVTTMALAYIAGISKGLEGARQTGLVAGFPVIDFKVTLVDLAFHDLDSSEAAFEMAARGAFQELREKGAPKLVEPIMRAEVETPEDCLSVVIADLNARRARIQRREKRGDGIAIDALAPLSNMFGYAANLKAMSQGRADFAMQFTHYAPVPQQPDGPENFPPAVGMRA